MTSQAVHRLDVLVTFFNILTWAALMLLLEKVADRRVRWVRLASFAPLHQASDHLPNTRGPLHGVFILAALVWLCAVLVPSSKIRPPLFIAHAAFLLLLATAWAASFG